MMGFGRVGLKALGVVVTVAILFGCSAAPPQKSTAAPAKRPVDEIVKEGVVYAIDVHDPWEGFNRRAYKFNTKFDQFVFLPAVNAYETITPGLSRARGVERVLEPVRDPKLLELPASIEAGVDRDRAGAVSRSTPPWVSVVYGMLRPLPIFRNEMRTSVKPWGTTGWGTVLF